MKTVLVWLFGLAVSISLLGCSKTATPKAEAKAQPPSVDQQKKMDEEFAEKLRAESQRIEAQVTQTSEAAPAIVQTSQEEKLKQRVLLKLKDPASAQFRNLRLSGNALCGEVNAKNSFGGYGGFSSFVADDQDAYVSPLDKDQDFIAYALWYQKASDHGCRQ